jgi:site-specific DNA-adenine methylase
MTLTNLDKTPFPWFGGKSKAAPLVWELLGDVPHYCEPFAGSLAVLLNRPHPCNRSYFSETVNDLDALLVNAWRAIQWHPEETAGHASWPVSENDKHARQIALVRWREERCPDLLAGSPEWCDPKMAGWWLWGVCVQIGAFAAGGPWTADDTGRIVKIDRKAESRGEPGVKRGLPHLTGNGQGVNRPGAREPGVTRGLPDLPDNGRGVNHAGTREPGVTRNRPHLTNNGMGVNRPGAREPGVTAQVSEFHPWTMPELVRWFDYLSARLRHVRILNGDWSRLVTTGASKTLMVRQGKGPAGIFLDPPYADTADRMAGLYASEDLDVAHKVKDWCAANGDDPERRIVLAGYDGEHDNQLADLGWTEHEWFTAGYLTGGYAQSNDGGHQQDRERLWASPHCLTPGPTEPDPQQNLFDQ